MKSTNQTRRIFTRSTLLVFLSVFVGGLSLPAAEQKPAAVEFSFFVAGDMQNFAAGAPEGKRYFDGACEAMQRVGAGAFLLTPGDVNPPAPLRAVVDRYLGSGFPWYVAVGNHEFDADTTLAWVRQSAAAGRSPSVVRTGPPGAEFTYSFDFANAHFVAIDPYPEGKSGDKGRVDISDATFDWLEKDLTATRQPLIFVFGHPAIYPMPDMDTGRIRHAGEFVSADPARAARFVDLLKKYHVRAYLCGHTHNASVARVHGIWQADSGHARGGGDPGSPSTFLKFRISGEQAWADIYRADPNGVDYKLRKTVQLD